MCGVKGEQAGPSGIQFLVFLRLLSDNLQPFQHPPVLNRLVSQQIFLDCLSYTKHGDCVFTMK